MAADAAALDATPSHAPQPREVVVRDGIEYVLLGTAHVSLASVEAVEAELTAGGWDAIAVELDERRHQAMADPDALHRMDLVKVIREGKTSAFAANLALAAYQRRLAEQLGIEPGAELKAAADGAIASGVPLRLIDRDVGLTFHRAMARLGWWGRAKVGAGLMLSLFGDDEVDHAEVEKLKQGDMLERSFADFAAGAPALYEVLIAERDRYMAAHLRGLAEATPRPARVLAVVGAGHLAGLARHLAEDAGPPAAQREALEQRIEGSKVPWFTLLLAALLLGGFAWGFATGGVEVGAGMMLQWILATGLLGALGALIAGGHPLSILAAFVASPITPLHPALASGTVSALVEASLRRPTYADFLALRDDVQTLRGWWRNRVARVLLNFFLTSVGTAIGVWTGGLAILGKLV